MVCQAVSAKFEKLFIHVLQSHNCSCPLSGVLLVQFFICSSLRSGYLSASVNQLCSSCTASVQDHLKIPHLPSGKMLCPDKTWKETAKHL